MRGSQAHKNTKREREEKIMSSGTRMLVKILIFIVSYAVAFALAFFGFSQFNGGDTSAFGWIIFAILAICGYRAIGRLPSLIFSGGPSGQGFFLTVFFFVIKICLSAFAGIFIAPWMAAKKLSSLVPGEKADSPAEE